MVWECVVVNSGSTSESAKQCYGLEWSEVKWSAVKLGIPRRRHGIECRAHRWGKVR